MKVFLLTHIRHARDADGSVRHVGEAGELIWVEE
jgi:hypothetical protein